MLFVPKVPVLVLVIYYLPDHPHILERLHWGTEDEVPQFPRVTEYVNHWKENIDTVVNSIFIDAGTAALPSRFRHVNELYQLH